MADRIREAVFGGSTHPGRGCARWSCPAGGRPGTDEDIAAVAGQARRPALQLAAALEREARKSWQPRVRQRAIRRAGQAGIVVEARAQFGFTAAPGSTDDPRMRRITEAIDPPTTAALLAAYQTGAGEAYLRQILADGLGHAYFRDRGRRADGLDVEINTIDYLDIDLIEPTREFPKER